MIEVEGVARLEKQRVLAAFRAKPEAILAAEHVHVRLFRAGGDRGAAKPAEAGRIASASRAGHDPSLVRGCDGNPRTSGGLGQQHDLSVLA